MEVKLRVRYAETDAQGIAYHSNHLIWFEVARTEWFRRAVGESPGEFFRTHGMPLTEAAVRYHQPCRYDDDLTISITPARMRSRSVGFDYVVRRGDDLISEGHTEHVCVNEAGAPCRIPAALRQALVATSIAGD